MKIYQATFYDNSEGACLSWHSSKRAAMSHLREQRAADPDGGPAPEARDVHTYDIRADRKGLIDWLNIHFTRDNG
jgi:hypothetical protein